MEANFKYDAFISYRHISPDKEIAEALQKKLESYKPPKSLQAESNRKNLRVFRDETELTTSSDLSADIKSALEQSDFLISICSKTTKESRWCMEEIEYFKELHGGNNAKIITLVADGTPEDVFPELLCNELIQVTDDSGNVTLQNHVIEPLAANVAGCSIKDSLKKLNLEFLRIVAPIFGCGYDTLYNREQKKKTKRMLAVGSFIIAFLLLFGIYNSAMLWEINSQKTALAAANADLKAKSEELNQSNVELQQSNDELAKKTKEAEENLEEATKQRKAAEENLAEAEKQRKIAEQNLTEANRQKKIAEENMRVAQENEAKANEANRNLREKTSEILANQSQIYLEDNDLDGAVKAAIEAISLSEENNSASGIAENTLTTVTGIYRYGERMLPKVVKLSGYVNFMEFSPDGKRVLATDINDIVYIINYETASVVKTYTPLETFGKSSKDYSVLDDIIIDGNTAYILCGNQVTAFDLNDGGIKWQKAVEQKGYSYFEELATNSNSDYLIVAGSKFPVVMKKTNGELQRSFEENENNLYSIEDNYKYLLGTDNRIYCANSEQKIITVFDINAGSVESYPLNAGEGSSILAVGESEDLIYVNIHTYESYVEENKALMVCYNKADMSLKWETEYTSAIFSNLYLNKIFDFKHALYDSQMSPLAKDAVISVTGRNITSFDKKTGQICFETDLKDEEKILYCEPNGYNYLIVADTKTFTKGAMLMNEQSALVSEDTLFYISSYYNFDNPQKFVSYNHDGRLAIATENSSEIIFCYEHYDSNYTVLEEFPYVNGLLASSLTDNGEGIFAGFYNDYRNNERKTFLVIYDTGNTKLLNHSEVGEDFSDICFIDKDRLFLSAEKGDAAVIRTDGTVIATGNIHELIKKQPGFNENTYLNSYGVHLSPLENGVLYGISKGLFEVRISGNTFVLNKGLNGYEHLEYNSPGDYISFVKYDSYASECKIAYLKKGDFELKYITDNGEEALFKNETITSVVNDGSGKLAFINEEGYIGLYDFGRCELKKIVLQKNELAPVKLTFSPDSEYLIAMCANSEFVKYSVKTLQEVGRYKSELVIDSRSELEFVDDVTFMAKKYSTSSEVFLIDMESMELKTEIGSFVYFLKNEKKIIFKTPDEKMGHCMYNYLNREELIEFAEAFLSKMGG